jgi:uracil-DNA glycosylase family 4
MTSDDALEKTLQEVSIFLKQTIELFGAETLILDSQQPAEQVTNSELKEIPQAAGQLGKKKYVISEVDTAGKAPQFPTGEQESKNVETSPLRADRNIEAKHKTRTIKVSEEASLFDGAVLKAEWKIDPKWHESNSLEVLNSRISSCMKCPLGITRKNFVFGVGNPKAKLVLIGEAPGADEDEQGEPFVGRAGQLLNKILAAVQFRREDVYICNILKCRPPNNRDPLPEEVDACEPFLKKQLEIIKPKLILCLGRIAGQTLLKTNATLAELRNNVYEYEGIKVLVTFHPAALLRNPNWKRPAWEDVQKMRRMYDEL